MQTQTWSWTQGYCLPQHRQWPQHRQRYVQSLLLPVFVKDPYSAAYRQIEGFKATRLRHTHRVCLPSKSLRLPLSSICPQTRSLQPWMSRANLQ